MNTRLRLLTSLNCRKATFANLTTNKVQQLLTAALLAASLAVTAPAASGAQKLWNGLAGDMLWSTSGNWSPAGMPGISDNVILTNDAATDFPFALGGSPDSFVDSLFVSPSINSLGFMNING